jgi:CRP-like cAMP-binding protein
MPLPAPLRQAGRAARRFYRRVASRSHDARAHEVAELLQATALFGACSSGTLLELAEAMHARTYRAEECLYYEGDPGLGLYVVQAGRIRLLVEDQGAAYELRRAERGDVFGVAALVHDVQRLETAQTTEDARVLGFFRPDLTNLTKRNPRAGAEATQAVARYLAAQLRDLVAQVGRHAAPRTALRAYAEAMPTSREG